MSKLSSKYLEDYSLDTLRDSNITSPGANQYLVYNATSNKWENTSIPAFGRDSISKTKVASETTTGGSFVTYDTLTFNVSDTGGVNKYRLNADFLWGHNAGGNDIRVQIVLDGSAVKELRIEPKDPGTDQRIQNNLLYYAENLSQGNHTLELQYRPSVGNRISRMYESVIECWRQQ